MVGIGPTDILVFTHDLGNGDSSILIVDRKSLRTLSFLTDSIVDKSILFKSPTNVPEFIDKAIKQKGFYFNNQYINIDTRTVNGLQIFLT